jgi:hypothetical protein
MHPYFADLPRGEASPRVLEYFVVHRRLCSMKCKGLNRLTAALPVVTFSRVAAFFES